MTRGGRVCVAFVTAAAWWWARRRIRRALQCEGRAIHIIPVPAGLSVEQAWEHIRRGRPFPSWAPIPPDGDGDSHHGGRWAIVETDRGRFVRVVDE